MSKHILDRLRQVGRSSRLARFLGIERQWSDSGDRSTFRTLRSREEAARGGDQRIAPFLRQARQGD